MTRIGITGHQSIPDVAHGFVSSALRDELRCASEDGPITGVTSLAAGADQLFATLVLTCGGTLHVVVPSTGYERTFDEGGLRTFRDLIARAAEVEYLPFDSPTEEAFYAAGKRVVDLSDIVLAVWDGQPSRGLGGTADVVRYAEQKGQEVRVIWPAGVSR